MLAAVTSRRLRALPPKNTGMPSKADSTSSSKAALNDRAMAAEWLRPLARRAMSSMVRAANES